MNFICFILQNARHDLQKQLLEDKVKALENELERARNRLQSLRAQAEERVIGATVGCWFLGGRKSGIPGENTLVIAYQQQHCVEAGSRTPDTSVAPTLFASSLAINEKASHSL